MFSNILQVLDGAMRMGKAYIELHTAGNVLFHDWKALIYCSVQRKVTVDVYFRLLGINVQGSKPICEELPQLGRALEQCLENWQQHMYEKRDRFPFLNWYTAKQLVFLSSELAQFMLERGVSAQALNLLSFLKSECTEQDVKGALDLAIAAVNAQEKEENRCLHQSPLEDQDGLLKYDEVLKLLENLQEQGISEDLAKAAIESCGATADANDIFTFAVSLMEDHLEVEQLCMKFDERHRNTSRSQVKVAQLSSLKDITEDNRNDFKINRTNCFETITALWFFYKEKLSHVVSKEYLSLDILGQTLSYLDSCEKMVITRGLPTCYSEGRPNLVTCSDAELFPSLVSLYAESNGQPLPTYDEVLVCSDKTTKEECELFIRRAVVGAAGSLQKIYSLVFAEQLTYEVAMHFDKLQKNFAKDIAYRLVLFCSSDKKHTYFATAFDSCRVVNHTCLSSQRLKQYLNEQFDIGKNTDSPACAYPDGKHIHLVSSQCPGVGKSLFIKNTVAHSKEVLKNPDLSYVIIRLTQSEINEEYLTERFLEHQDKPGQQRARVFHIDVTPAVKKGFELLLMKLFVLGYLRGRGGKVWRRHPAHAYFVELLNCRPAHSSARQDRKMENVIDLFPLTQCETPKAVLQRYRERPRPSQEEIFQCPAMDPNIFRSDVFQRPLQYLSRFKANANLDLFTFNNTVEGSPEGCLRTLLYFCGLSNPSWSELYNFSTFLNVQLMDCELSVFCSVAATGDALQGFKNFVVKFMVIMAKDFATPSLNICDESPSRRRGADAPLDNLETYSFRRRWESDLHPYIFFNADHTSMTFLGIHINAQYNAISPVTGQVILEHAMSQQMYKQLLFQRVPFNINFDGLPRSDKINYLSLVLGVDSPFDPDEMYELTTDNVLKMMAIQMRFRCDIPVIIMGETGCGKTRLIEYMCDMQRAGKDISNMVLVKVHGGMTTDHIQQKIKRAASLAQNNEKYAIDTVLFFDEANTTEAIYSIKEALCDRTMDGEPIKTSRLKIIAACNPYRKHSEKMIKRLESAGLGYRIRTEDTEEKMGRVPLRQLVYRVQPLPPSMLPLVWDFGQLSNRTEKQYIQQMVQRFAVTQEIPFESVNLISNVLATSQEYLKSRNDECSFVSLRNVDRCMKVFIWFYTHQHQLFPKILDRVNPDEFVEQEDEEDETVQCIRQLDCVTRSLILAVGVCYHASLEDRADYRHAIAQKIPAFSTLSDPSSQVLREILLCQDVFLESVHLESTIARNAALKENIFMMVVCIEQRIPLFLIGKPGSSKSLAKTVVSDAMQGQAARSDLFKGFKQTHLVSFQCSPHSSAEGIISTFRQCAAFQQAQKLEEYVSVVVLDEVGLAEDSPHMPLKTLHPLLEDGCVGDEIPKAHMKVGFVGISNWALDPAKINRGILVFRGVPDEKELIRSAQGICSSDVHTCQRVEKLFPSLAQAYLRVCKEQEREFFGLRDYYSLVKMLYSFAKESGTFPTRGELLQAVLRNFGGFQKVNVRSAFQKSLSEVPDDDSHKEFCPLDFVKTNVDTSSGSTEFRYLLLLTSNCAALTILQLYHTLDLQETVTLFGSSFPMDQEYTQVCRNINTIKVCMETGKTVILMSMQNLYESLYDVMNQYYVYLGGNRYVDLGLGSHRVKCRVKPDFRLIVIEEKDVVYDKFPVPLINRLEKHCLEMTTILTQEQQDFTNELKKWAEDFSASAEPPGLDQRANKIGRFTVADAFIGYHEDACASIIIDLFHQKVEKHTILAIAKKILMECCTPDTIIRYCKKESPLKQMVLHTYFEEQQHGSLLVVLHQQLKRDVGDVFLEVSTHSRLLSLNDIPRIETELDKVVRLLSLNEFDTQQSFCRALRDFWSCEGNELLVLQYSFEDSDLSPQMIACARYCIANQRPHDPTSAEKTHVVFITNVPRVSGGCGYVGFSGGKWVSLHLDELLPSQIFDDDIMTLCRTPVSELLKVDRFSTGDIAMESDNSWNHNIDTRYLLKSCLQPALAQLQDPPEKVERTTTRLHSLMELFNDMDSDESIYFVKLLQQKVVDLLHQQEHQRGQNADYWVWDQAASLQDILYSGTFRQSLWKHLQAKLCPILTAVLAYIDCDENLELLRPITEDPLSIRKLWLRLFENENVCALEIPRQRRQLITVMSSNMPGRFQASTRLPFSWLIHDHIEKLWKKVQHYSVEIAMPAEEALLKQLNSSPIAYLLSSELGSPELLQLYCHDLVRIQMQLSSSEEHELLSSALFQAAHQSGDQALSLPSLHIVLSKLRPRLQGFSQLAKDFPDDMPSLLRQLRAQLGEQQQPGLLDLEAASACLHLLDLQQDQTQFQAFATWSHRVISIQPSMDAILEGLSECFLDDQTKIRLSQLRVHWKRILVVHLFLERMIEGHEHAEILTIVHKYALCLWKVLDKCDFSSLPTLKCIINVLHMCNEGSSTLHFSGGVKQCRLCQRAIGIPVALPCKHVFCQQCLIEWMKTDSTCQSCRACIPRDFEFIPTYNIQ
uniref:E3 ubiquitin-protein ligase rnf213-alpha-like n=1 Tax=Myxine glutinosa TaxID=7769 RepID=UPI00358DE57A